MTSDSGGKSNVARFAALLSGCFGRRRKRVSHLKTQKPKRGIKFPTSFLKKNSKTGCQDLFLQQLQKENLLAPGSTKNENPIINIGLGFQNEELQYAGSKIYYRSYAKSRWDRVLSGRKCREGIQEIADARISFNEPIVDDLPASIWMECLEPTLSVLMALSAMKHRRTNLTACRSTGRSVNLTILDSRIRHGDFNLDALNEMIGPIQVLQLNTTRLITDEVRPSRLIDLTGSPLSVEYDVEINDQSTRRNKQRTIFTRPAQPIHIADDEPLVYTFYDDESDTDYSLSDFEDDENVNQSASNNQGGQYPEIRLSDQSVLFSFDTNSNSLNKLKMRTYLWRERYGKHFPSEPEEITTEEANAMQNHWLKYLNNVKDDKATKEDADLLHSRLKNDPWNRRRFLKDAVLFLADIDKEDSLKRKQRYQRQLEFSNEEDSADGSSASNVSVDSNITIDSVSDISSELANVELEPLPPAPNKQLHLMVEDYVICNVVPRSYDLGPGTSVESLTSNESDPYESVRRMCQPESTDRPKGVVVITDTYSIPDREKTAQQRVSIPDQKQLQQKTEAQAKANLMPKSVSQQTSPSQQKSKPQQRPISTLKQNSGTQQKSTLKQNSENQQKSAFKQNSGTQKKSIPKKKLEQQQQSEHHLKTIGPKRSERKQGSMAEQKSKHKKISSSKENSVSNDKIGSNDELTDIDKSATSALSVYSRRSCEEIETLP